jgi:hypothetical protein
MRVSEEPVVEFLNYLWARNRVGIWLSYRPAARLHSTQHGGIGSLESILGLLKSLKIRALFAVVSFGLLPDKPLLSLYGTEWRKCVYGLSILRYIEKEANT